MKTNIHLSIGDRIQKIQVTKINKYKLKISQKQRAQKQDNGCMSDKKFNLSNKNSTRFLIDQRERYPLTH